MTVAYHAEKRGNWAEKNTGMYYRGYHPEHKVRGVDRMKDEAGYSGPFLLAGIGGALLVGLLLFRN